MVDDNLQQQRLGSLDAMRGFVMFLLIGGGEIGHAGILSALFSMFDNPVAKTLYQQLQYSWYGPIHVKDLVRPLFIFVVGVAMPYAFGKRLHHGDSNKRQLYFHVIRRTAVLFVLGMIAGGHLLEFDLQKFYICNNVLEEIAIGYLVASVILLNFNVRGQLVAIAVLLLGYWALIVLVPVPGHGAGILTPEVNLPRYVDDVILGRFRPKWPFTWVISLPLASSCIVMLGAVAGQLLKSMRGPVAKLGWLMGTALGCLVLSLVWSHWYPMIIFLGTGSWVLFVGASGFGLLALFYLIIDVWGFRKWAFPFVVIGSNSIAVYMAAHLFDFRLIGNVFVGGLAKWVGPWNDFVQAAAAFAVIWLIMLWMYRTKTFIKV